MTGHRLALLVGVAMLTGCASAEMPSDAPAQLKKVAPRAIANVKNRSNLSWGNAST